MKRIILILFMFLLSIGGCTYTVKAPLVPVFDTNNYLKNKLSTVKPAITFIQGNFTDKRTDSDILATYKRSYQTYKFYGERPIDEVLFEGLNVLMTSSGHEWADINDGEIKIDLELLRVQVSFHEPEFTLIAEASSNIHIKLDFIDPSTNDVIYTKIYQGTNASKGSIVYIDYYVTDFAILSIDASIVDCINNVGEDESLAQALIKFGR
jgi:uncharacterized lipoprotein YajG